MLLTLKTLLFMFGTTTEFVVVILEFMFMEKHFRSTFHMMTNKGYRVSSGQ